MKKILILTALFICSLSLSAAVVDTIEVYSESMQKNIKNVIILPDGYSDNNTYPVLYLLHGHGGTYATWTNKTKKSLPQKVDKWSMIIVSPDGQDSWYWDSSVDSTSRFETYVSKELVEYIDSNYRTIPEAKGRAISGFSMGGHGAMWLASHHPDVYGACGSMSGGLDLRPFPKSWNLKQHLGAYATYKEVWDRYVTINNIDKLKDAKLSIIIDCGIDDFFFDVNVNFHNELVKQKIPHDYIIRPGKHDHAYWNNAIDYQLLFFSNFFR